MNKRATRRSRRINKKRAVAAPLLAWANHIEQTTPEIEAENLKRIDASNARHFERMAQQSIKTEAYGQQLRSLVAEHVLPGRLAQLDTGRAVAPETSEYTADFWSHVARDMGLLCYVTDKGRV